MPRVFFRRLRKYISSLLSVLSTVILLCVLFLLIKFIIPVYQFAATNNITPSFVYKLIAKKEVNLKNYKGRTNLILLGIGGPDHAGDDLTDSIIFLSIDKTSNDFVMLSIPRDLWMNSLKDKINTAYHYGEKEKKGGGIILAKSTIEEVINQPIHYSIMLDFSAFRNLIDLSGGVDINVQESFEDKMYPIAGRENDFCGGDILLLCRYETVSFQKGLQHMDGEMALKYVRSRHSEGEQGNDFARSQRQQQVIMAFKDKLLTFDPVHDYVNIKQIIEGINSMIKADMDWSEKISLASILVKIKDTNIRHIVLDDGSTSPTKKGYLVNPPLWKYDGAWVVEPRTGNFKEIQEYISCQINDSNCQMKP